MPAYNEEAFIARSIADVKNRISLVRSDYEIVVVDDGSVDGTRKIAETEAIDSTVRIVGYDVNKGKGYAIRYGFKHATGSATFFLDSDSEIQSSKMDLYLKALANSDIVIASKRHPESIVQTPLVRKFMSRIFNVITRILTGLDVSDSQSGLKAARSEALYRILPLLSVKRYAFDVEFLVVASLLGMKVRELPIEIRSESMFGMRKVARMGVDLLGIVYRLRLIRWYQKNMVALSNTYVPLVRW
jgi:glycosyltransferase involved in cell wall biosynthesis